ncbi:MAG: hypothetical protein ACTHM8_07460 [Sphingomonas sp.]
MRTVMIGAALIAAGMQQAGGDATLTPGTVTVEVIDTQKQHPALDHMVAETVGDALTDANFLILPGEGHGRYIARVTVSQEARGTVATKSGGGGAVFGGTSASVSLGHSAHLSGLVVTRLDLDLVARESGATVWHGSGSTAQVEDSAAGAPAAIVKKLAKAVIGRFPQRMDEPIAVP